MIGTIAERFGLDPDVVYNKPFNFVVNFMVMWREQEAYGKRLREADKALRSKDDTTANT